MTASRVCVGKINGGPDIGSWLVWCPPCGMSIAVASWQIAMRVANMHASELARAASPSYPRTPGGAP